MKKFIVSTAVFAALAAPAAAQVTTPGDTLAGKAVTAGHGSFYVGPYAGYMRFGKLGDAGSGKLSMENGLFYGGQAGYSFSPNVSVVGNLGYTRSKFVIRDIAGASGGSENVSNDVGTFFYDGNVQFRLPFIANALGSTVAPFTQLGVGQIKYSFNDRLNADVNQSETKFTYNVGLGTDIQIRKLIGVRLMAKDYITSFDFDKYYDVANSTKSRVSNNLAFTAGLNFGF